MLKVVTFYIDETNFCIAMFSVFNPIIYKIYIAFNKQFLLTYKSRHFIINISFRILNFFLFCRIPNHKTNRKLPFYIIKSLRRNNKHFF